MITAKTLQDRAQSPRISSSGSSEAITEPSFTLSDEGIHEARRRPSIYPDLGDRSASPHAQRLSSTRPSSLEVQQRSSSASIASLTKENVAKLPVLSKHCSRTSPPIQIPNSDADDEDDDINTESDLETHADEEAIEYSANPAEEDEGHHILRTQFNKVAIRKRAHAEVDDAEADDEESGRSGGLAHTTSEDQGSDRQNRGRPTSSSAEEEKDDGRFSKKARMQSWEGKWDTSED